METLRIARIRIGWSQEQLAEVCNVTSVTISNLENGKTSPQERTRHRLEVILGQIDWRLTKEEALIQMNGHHKMEEK